MSTRKITVAIDSRCRHANIPFIWGTAPGCSTRARIRAERDAALWLGQDGQEDEGRRSARALDYAVIPWERGELPDGQNNIAIERALAAVKAR